MKPYLLLGFLVAVILQTTAGLDSSHHNLFSSDIYKEVRKANKGNFAVCPLSAQIILALVHAGAGGKTAQELSSALHLPVEKEKVQEIFKELSPHLRGNEYYNLSSANKVYVQKNYNVKDAYRKIAEGVFNAEIQNIDFGKKTEAVGEMNQWVEEKTQNKIRNLISEGDITAGTRSVLINAMYFKANWSQQFNEKFTSKKAFYINAREDKQTDMMMDTSHYKYYESSDLKAKFLEMPYAGGEISMTFVLPNEREGLSLLEENIGKVLVAPQYQDRKVHVEIPKFIIETKIDFTEILQKLGVLEAFGDAANFQDILVEERLKISKVLQKTFIEVMEGGTEAAAATVVIAVGASASNAKPPPIMYFVADHPFIYYIKIKDVVFFVGRYITP